MVSFRQGQTRSNLMTFNIWTINNQKMFEDNILAMLAHEQK